MSLLVTSFSLAGELIAARQQARHHSALAERALLTETVGQTCWFHYAPCNIGLPLRDRAFPPQKALTFPTYLLAQFEELQS